MTTEWPVTVAWQPPRPYEAPNPYRETVQERVVRHVRMLRAMREPQTGVRPLPQGTQGTSDMAKEPPTGYRAVPDPMSPASTALTVTPVGKGRATPSVTETLASLVDVRRRLSTARVSAVAAGPRSRRASAAGLFQASAGIPRRSRRVGDTAGDDGDGSRTRATSAFERRVPHGFPFSTAFPSDVHFTYPPAAAQTFARP